MPRQLLRTILAPLRRAARRFVMLPPPEEGSYVGTHGCLRAAASFATWNQVPGDYLEFGVYEGDSFATAYQAIQLQREKHHALGYDSPEYLAWRNARPRFFAFDGFGGIPEGEASRQVDYHAGSYACTEADFRRNVARRGVPESETIVVPGLFDQSLTDDVRTTHKLTQAAIAMIDCDLYESTVPVLDFLTPLVQQGTILIFHDWFRFRGNPDEGEQRACNEWLAKNPHLELIEYWREGPQAVAFLVNRKD